MSEFGDQVEKAKEFNLLRKVAPHAQNLKRFVYTTDENLRQQLLFIYPEATHVIIVNNDKRDCLGTPTINTRQIKSRTLVQTSSYRGRVINSQSWEQCSIVMALVDNNMVAVKKITREEPRY